MVVAMIEELLDVPTVEPGVRKAPESAHEPEDWPRLFTQRLNAGNLEAVMALYEPDARFAARSGEILELTSAVKKTVDGVTGGEACSQT
jgi:hypothetical protein